MYEPNDSSPPSLSSSRFRSKYDMPDMNRSPSLRSIYANHHQHLVLSSSTLNLIKWPTFETNTYRVYEYMSAEYESTVVDLLEHRAAPETVANERNGMHEANAVSQCAHHAWQWVLVDLITIDGHFRFIEIIWIQLKERKTRLTFGKYVRNKHQIVFNGVIAL